MPFKYIFRSLTRMGPVSIGLTRGRDGREINQAVCTADDCGWSAEFDTYAAACQAARGHRCRVRR